MTTQSDASEKRDAPAPDAQSKPDRISEIKRPSWKYIFPKAAKEFLWDHCTDLAAALTYYAVLAMFPALLAMVAILGLFGRAEETTRATLRFLEGVAPGQVTDLLRGVIQQLVSSPSAGLALIVGVLGALWSTSGYMGAFSRAINRIYEIDEGRSFWKLRPVMLLMALIAVVLAAIMAVILAVSGPVLQTVGNMIGLGQAAVVTWQIIKWPILVALAVLLLALLYYLTPNVKQPKFRWMSIGALTALVVMALSSLGFLFYVSNFAHYNRTYGTIGGFIVLLLWVWIINLAVLFGAELDSETERGRELQAGLEAEETLQLPPRDTSRSEKRRKQQEQSVAGGRAIRERFSTRDNESPATEHGG